MLFSQSEKIQFILWCLNALSSFIDIACLLNYIDYCVFVCICEETNRCKSTASLQLLTRCSLILHKLWSYLICFFPQQMNRWVEYTPTDLILSIENFIAMIW